jgi:hypothetical protein
MGAVAAAPNELRAAVSSARAASRSNTDWTKLGSAAKSTLSSCEAAALRPSALSPWLLATEAVEVL